MSSLAVSSTAQSVYFVRNGVVVSCGSTYSAGETLRAWISGTGIQYLLELGGGSFVDGCCINSVRIANTNDTSLTAPTSGTLSLTAGFASVSGTVSITDTCSLTLSSDDTNDSQAPTIASTTALANASTPMASISGKFASELSGTVLCFALLCAICASEAAGAW
eukprot:CAMPEP_0194532128 /NCGR_PEP_ID=MMETSP0253-20130528/69617_1 /TAXON_ID=2966 /ORGANISM="Noctiluca scintillans" /LENGTH=163 /DNA_ID=CAMNT_0039377547 /DNA_START=88 /DNA_END=576 /DNA_ORIENTATION=+